MARMIVEEKPPLDDELLIHYGVLGMKWGQRKKATTEDIHDARTRLEGKQEQYARQARKLATAKKSGSKTRIAAEKSKLDGMELAYLRNPDRAIGTRLTRGEKAMIMLAGMGSGATAGLPGIVTGATAGATVIGGVSLINRRVEYKQDKGSYKKKSK